MGGVRHVVVVGFVHVFYGLAVFCHWAGAVLFLSSLLPSSTEEEECE